MSTNNSGSKLANATSTPTTVTLDHVNTPPAQTWNYLKIDDVQFEVPTTDAKGKVFEATPRLFEAIETGGGAAAAHWIASAAGDGHYLEVPRGTILKDPIIIAVKPGEAANTAIMLRQGASASVVVIAAPKESSSQATAATSAALTRIFIEKNAHLDLFELAAGQQRSQHLENVGIRVGENATVTVHQYALGGSKVAFGIATELAGDHSKFDLTMRYYASGSDLLDVNHLCRQRGAQSRAEIHARGVLADSAQKTMRETIDLIHGARAAKGNEAETVLVLGEDVVNKTLPVILCDEEDVQGNHGATIGSISPEQIEYLAARGLDKTAAESLFVRAIFDDAVINAPESISRNAAVVRAAEVLGDDVAYDLVEGLGIELTDEKAAQAALNRGV